MHDERVLQARSLLLLNCLLPCCTGAWLAAGRGSYSLVCSHVLQCMTSSSTCLQLNHRHSLLCIHVSIDVVDKSTPCMHAQALCKGLSPPSCPFDETSNGQQPHDLHKQQKLRDALQIWHRLPPPRPACQHMPVMQVPCQHMPVMQVPCTLCWAPNRTPSCSHRAVWPCLCPCEVSIQQRAH